MNLQKNGYLFYSELLLLDQYLPRKLSNSILIGSGLPIIKLILFFGQLFYLNGGLV